MADSKLRYKVRSILEGEDPQWGHSVHYSMNVLILLSVILLSLETVDSFHTSYHYIFIWAEYFIIFAFALEYILRVWSAPSRLRYIFSFWGIVDLLAFAPALFAQVTSSTAVRALRLVRLLKLTRASGAIDILYVSLYRVRREMLAMLLLGAITLYISAVGIYLFENEAQPEAFGSIPAAIWWAAVTLTTVGYGDVYPITVGGRVFTMVVLTLGLGVVAVPTALLSASLVDVIRDRDDLREKRRRAKLDRGEPLDDDDMGLEDYEHIMKEEKE